MDLISGRFKQRKNSITRDIYPKDYFIFSRILLTLSGAWPVNIKHYLLRLLYKLYTRIVIIFVVIYFAAAQFISLKDTWTDVEVFIKNLSMALTHGIGIFKAVVWFVYKKRILYIISTLEHEDLHYEPCTVPKLSSETNDYKFRPGEIMAKARTRSNFFGFVLLVLCKWTLLSAYVPQISRVIWNPVYVYQNGTDGGKWVYEQNLPYYSWYPFELRTRELYAFAIITQMLSIFIYAYIIIAIDTMFMCMLYYVSAHLAVLRGAIRSIKTRALLRVSENEVDQEMQYQLKKNIIHLEIIFRTCKEIENLFCFLTLGQVLTTLFILCTCLYLVSSTPIKSTRFLVELAYMTAMLYELVMYCWYGNEVYLESSNIPLAVYECDWSGASKCLKSMLLVLMTRMNIPIYMTVGKFAPLTLSTFVSIIRASYSLFAVLKSMNDPSK